MSRTVGVLIVDDSAFYRKRIVDILAQSPDLEVVGMAENGQQAVEMAKRLKPDVITMDVEMPVMNGIEAVRRIMAEAPTPIIMFSSMTNEGARTTLDALDAGAVDFLLKQLDTNSNAAYVRLRQKIRHIGLTARARQGAAMLQQQQQSQAQPAPVARPAATATPRPAAAAARPASSVPMARPKLVVIGASTGGPVAMQQVLSQLPANFPVPLALVVHMPANFTAAYAERLNGVCRIGVKLAADGDAFVPGQALLAPGGMQMLMEERAGRAVVRVQESPPDQTYRPSVDISVGSAARLYGKHALAIVLTGMGSDGMRGAQALKRAGGHVWSQDEASCVVYGMPKAVEKAGLSDRVLSLADIGRALSGIH